MVWEGLGRFPRPDFEGPAGGMAALDKEHWWVAEMKRVLSCGLSWVWMRERNAHFGNDYVLFARPLVDLSLPFRVDAILPP